MGMVELLVGLVAACVVLALLARAVDVPPAVALVSGGMAVGFIPGMPRVELDPHIAMALFLPPLLQVSAFRTDWEAFRTELRPILLLALGAVLFTAAAVAATAKVMAPELPWAAALALGAIVAPPDAVAAASVLKAVHIPRRLMTILEGESLLNDASSLILYRFAVAAAVASVSLADAGVSFVASSVGGGVLGYVIGRVVIEGTRALDDVLLEIAAIVLAGFAAYMAAEAMHLSGVLAAVACGLVLGRHQHKLSARTRVESAAVLSFVEFVLTSLVFILIGLQLRDVLERLLERGLVGVGVIALAVSACLVLSRFVWVFLSDWVARVLPQRFRLGHARLPGAQMLILSWAGMRGVVSLAAALALPIGFPGRDLIVVLAFTAILVTLVLQGTTLGWVIRRLRVVEDKAGAEHEAAVRQAGAEAALATVEQRVFEGRVLGLPDRAMVGEFRRRAESAREMADGTGLAARRHTARLELEREALWSAREAVLAQGERIDGEALQAMVEELDFEERRLERALAQADGRETAA